jgi:RNA polymerase sigma factor (sigma-70 family)
MTHHGSNRNTPPSPDPDLRALYDTLRRLNPEPANADALVEALCVHPASRARLKRACASVLRSRSERRDVMADVMQEATCRVIQRTRSGRLRISPDSPERLGAWLWATWRNACRDAWRRHQSAVMPFERLPVVVEERPHPNSHWDDDRRADLHFVIGQVPEPLLRQVLRDWAAGLSGAESAQVLGRSTSWVSKARQRGLVWLRSALRQLWSAD